MVEQDKYERPKFYMPPSQVAAYLESGHIVKDDAGVMRLHNVPFYDGFEVVEVQRIPL